MKSDTGYSLTCSAYPKCNNNYNRKWLPRLIKSGAYKYINIYNMYTICVFVSYYTIYIYIYIYIAVTLKDHPCNICSAKVHTPVLKVQLELHGHLTPPGVMNSMEDRLIICFSCSNFWNDVGKIFQGICLLCIWNIFMCI